MIENSKETKKETEIYLVRHGETFAKTNENQLGMPFVCGSGSEICRITHLTDNGKKQMYEVGEKYKNTKFDLVVVSDLPRSIQSAEEFLKGSGQEKLIKEIVSDARLTEIDYGEDDGVAEEEIKEKKRNFFADKTKTAEEYDKLRGGETFAEAGKRMREAILDISRKCPNKKVLIISHSGSMRALAGNIVPGQDLKFGEVLKIVCDGQDFILSS
jgi:broad specificity phosphatase PhoE